MHIVLQFFDMRVPSFLKTVIRGAGYFLKANGHWPAKEWKVRGPSPFQ